MLYVCGYNYTYILRYPFIQTNKTLFISYSLSVLLFLFIINNNIKKIIIIHRKFLFSFVYYYNNYA